jgi:hypothetical protein
MKKPCNSEHSGSRIRLSLVVFTATCIALNVEAQLDEPTGPRGSLAGQRAIEELKGSLTNQDYNLHYGRIGFQTDARLDTAYNDNVLLSGINRRDDFIVHPQVTLGAFVPLTELNALKLALGVGYEWFAKNHSLNSDAPLIAPGSELVFNLFVKDFRIRLHDQFSYQQTIAINDQPVGQTRIYNFTNVTRFDRLDNFVGPTVDWDLNKSVLTLSYDHETFLSNTEQFRYLDRSSEWLTTTFNYLLGQQRKIGLETKVSDNNFDHETILNDSWRARVGPFSEWRLPEAILLRAGAGYDLARFDSNAHAGSDYDTWYGYVRLEQQLLWFTHNLEAGRETLTGDNANNLRMNYVRYSIVSEVLKDLELEGTISAEFSKEFGGSYRENFVQYVGGLGGQYHFHKYCWAGLAYEHFWNDSDTPTRSFHRNQVTVHLTFKY